MTFHQTILDQLLDYRSKKKSSFNFIPRQRNGAGKRFDNGYWFQGNDNYAFVGLINASGGTNRTRSVGIVFSPKDAGFNVWLEVVFKTIEDTELINCYNKILNQIGDFEMISPEKFKFEIGNVTSDDFSLVFKFIEEHYDSIIKIFRSAGREDVLLSDAKFNELIDNIREYKYIKNDSKESKYYLLGAYWEGADPEDQTNRFVNNGYWENGYEDKFTAEVKSIPVGSRIAIKSVFTREKTKSVMAIKARGTVLENLNNGLKLEVDWEKDFSPFEVDFSGGYWATISEVTNQEHIKRIWHPNDKQSEIESRVIYAYLKKALSHRQIQKDILGKDAPARGGGFKTMSILHKYDIQKDKKGILARHPFKEEYHKAKDNYLKALTLLKKYYAEFNNETINQVTMALPLNTILYGPPGTGKTFKLKEKYFQQFTLSETSLSKEQFIINLVSDLTWWQTFAIALYQIGTASVDQLLEHEIVKAKASLSKAKNIRPIAWSRMQAHAVADCPNVNVSDSSEPPLFYKEKDSQWRVVKENVEQLYPEGIEILEQIHNFQPNQDNMVKNYEFVTFHQSYGYEDFVEGIKPKLEDESTKLEYEITEGIFKKLCNRAEKDLDNNYAIFIDEINRGNVSAIFGELITLIETDKRLGEPQELKVKLPYSKTEFGVPPNLYIIGTMNTADRSVEALDTALRRRFVFEEVMPDPTLLSHIAFNGFNLEEVLDTINRRIEALLDRDHTIGHSYFIKIKNGDTAGLQSVFKNNIIPLLQEYFFNDHQKIALVLGPGFVEEKEAETILFPKFNSIDNPQLETSYHLIHEIHDIEEAILKCLGKSNE